MLAELPKINNLWGRLNFVFEGEHALIDIVYQSYSKATTKIQEDYSKPGSERYRAYHNFEHTRAVLNAVLDMHQNAPEEEKLKSEELALLLVAASYHDTVFEDGPPKQNELDSGELAVTELRDYLDDEQKQVLKLMIESTYTTVSEEGLNRSVEVVDEIGGYRVKLMSQILQDADVSTLGTKEFAKATKSLAEEWGNTNNFRTFLELQLQILTNHNFQTKAGKVTFTQVLQNRELLQQYLNEREVTAEGLLKFFEEHWAEQV